ncbi:MAG: DUF308 domain-containing protein [Oscillospiraceae bacterium]|jgi:hypothetical protein|nr:DUF308 domain-containing protein [Oscillospiraceae bacterium]
MTKAAETHYLSAEYTLATAISMPEVTGVDFTLKAAQYKRAAAEYRETAALGSTRLGDATARAEECDALSNECARRAEACFAAEDRAIKNRRIIENTTFAVLATIAYFIVSIGPTILIGIWMFANGGENMTFFWVWIALAILSVIVGLIIIIPKWKKHKTPKYKDIKY